MNFDTLSVEGGKDNMKRWYILIIALLITGMLSACNQDTNGESEESKGTSHNTEAIKNEDSSVENGENQQENTADDDSSKVEKQGDTKLEIVEENHQNEWESLPEFSKINEKIHANQFTIETATDNRGKRILLFKDESGKVKYKSIFIKNSNRLKLIHTDSGENEIYNEVIH